MTGNSDGALTRGINHLGLTVPELAVTADFFQRVLGFSKVGEKPDYPAVFVSDGHTMITLWQAKAETPVGFNRQQNIGLHHVALAVADTAALDALYERLLQQDNVTVEFAPEALGEAPFRHMMCLIPGGIRTEFIAPAG